MARPIPLEPFDEYNQRLQANVYPSDWQNPTPDGPYNLVVIGAGTAGLVCAAGAAGMGAKVALIERELLGGDCLNVGCVPSKGLIAAARAARHVRQAETFGVNIPGQATVDFPEVMQRMRRLRAEISRHDSAQRFRDLGVDVFLGQACFTSGDRLDVEGQTLSFKKAVLCTGARAQAPSIPGLAEVAYLTNESIFSLTELPRRLGIVGAGPIGCELAQAFAQFGAEVLLVESDHGVMQKEDRDAAAIVEEALRRDGVRLLCCGRDMQVRRGDDHSVRLVLESHGQSYDEPVDQLLIAAGRAPNVQGMGLEAAGVEFDEKTGVTVNDRLQTTNGRIYAAGDVCSKYKFTHAADFLARTVIRNALFWGRSKASALTIPWCTYTSPEIAQVGLTPHEADEQGVQIETFTQSFDEVDRAVLEGQAEGFARVHVRQGTDQIVGATIVAAHAGDLIGEASLAMTHGLGLKKIATAIHPYPTQAEAIRKLGDQYNRTRLTPTVKWALEKWLQWSR